MIRYTAGTTAPYDYGTIATFSCNDGFALVGSTARTCSGSGQSVKGVWNESIPYCKLLSLAASKDVCIHVLL